MESARIALVLAAALVLPGCVGGLVTPSSTDAPLPGPDPVEELERRLTPEDVSASEVHIETDPGQPRHLVAAANAQGGFDVYVSWDAGGSWNRTHVSPEDVASAAGHPGFAALSDPVVAFGPDGMVYLSGLAYVPTSAVVVAESTDGGETWTEANVVHESDPATSFNDKEWMAVSPVTGSIVVAWQKEPAVDQLRRLDGTVPAVDPDPGNIVVSRSEDGGESWSEPVEVDRGRDNNGTQVLFTPDGRAHLLWMNYERRAIDYVVSHDDGRTWTDPEAIAEGIAVVPPYDRYQRMHTLPGFAAGPDGEVLAAVWHDRRAGDADVWAVASGDGGQTWTDEVRVNQDERGNGVIQIYPWVEVGPEGRIHASWYDASADPEEPLFRYHRGVAPGPGLGFVPSGPASEEAFTAFASRDSEEDTHRGLGDYTGIAASEAGVFPAWADGRGNESRIFAARLPIDG
jgi:hypothetical protein